MLRPLMVALPPVAQSSRSGSGSPIIVPFSPAPAGATPCVFPLMRLIAPGVDGP